MVIQIYHNPKCATSRRALQRLRDRGLEPEIINYIKEPLSRSGLQQLLKLLGLHARDLLRTREPEFKKLRLDRPSIKDSEILDAMVRYPKLIQRPIVVVNHRKAVVARPIELVDGIVS